MEKGAKEVLGTVTTVLSITRNRKITGPSVRDVGLARGVLSIFNAQYSSAWAIAQSINRNVKPHLACSTV